GADREPTPHAAQPVFSQASCFGGIRQESSNGPCQTRGVGGLHEDARLALHDQLWVTSNAGRHDRSRRSHRLQDRDGEALRKRGQHEHVTERQELRDVVTKAKEPHVAVDRETSRLFPESRLTLAAPRDQEYG